MSDENRKPALTDDEACLGDDESKSVSSTDVSAPIFEEEPQGILSPDMIQRLQAMGVPIPENGKVSLEVLLQARHHAGPIPSPEDCAAYERFAPGTTDRFFQMLEKQVQHRMALERADSETHNALLMEIQRDKQEIVKLNSVESWKDQRLRRIFVLVAAIAGLVLAGYALYKGASGAAVGIVVAMSAVAAYVGLRHDQQSDTSKKDDAKISSDDTPEQVQSGNSKQPKAET